MIAVKVKSSAWAGLTRSLFVLSIGLFVFPVDPGATTVAQQSTRERFDQLVGQWREAAKAAIVAGGKFHVAEREEADAFEKQWREALEEGNRYLKQLRPVAIKLVRESDSTDEELAQLVTRFLEQDLESGLYERAFELTGLLLGKDIQGELRNRIMTSRAAAAVLTNRFELASDIQDDAPYVLDDMPVRAKQLYFSFLDELRSKYADELAKREAERDADDLPRVEIKTTKGTIVAELFENEAPETVGNFISLVERNAYDGMIFHRVINDFMAQTGGYNKQGHRAVIGYTIFDECHKPEARKHFRGSLSMAKTSEPDSASSQFFINFVATPQLDNIHTVFGRVISGWEALDRLNRTHTATEDGQEEPIPSAVPDQIISIRVLRKRDHDYQPNKVE